MTKSDLSKIEKMALWVQHNNLKETRSYKMLVYIPTMVIWLICTIALVLIIGDEMQIVVVVAPILLILSWYAVLYTLGKFDTIGWNILTKKKESGDALGKKKKNVAAVPRVKKEKIDYYELLANVENGDINKVKKMFEKHAPPSSINIDKKYDEEETVLIKAIKKRNIEMVKLLIENGADINVRANGDVTPLMYAALESEFQTDIVELLIKEGADVHAKDSMGDTAKEFALRMGDLDLSEIITAAMMPLIDAVKREDIPEIKKMISQGVDLNIRSNEDNEDKSALMWACEKGNTEIIKLLLAAGMDPNEQNSWERSALTYSVIKGDVNNTQLLIQHGGDVNLENSYGYSILMYASEEGHENLIPLLLDAGADLNKQTKDGKSALTYAVINGHTGVFQLLIEKGADLNIIDEAGQTLVIFAVKNNQCDILQKLIKEKVDINKKDREEKITPLMHAIEEQHKECVEILLKNKAKINQRDQSKQTELMRTLTNYFSVCAPLLIRAGCDIHAKDDMGRTALMYASLNQNWDVVELLIDQGADVNVKDRHGDTALSFGGDHYSKIVYNLLKEAGAKE